MSNRLAALYRLKLTRIVKTYFKQPPHPIAGDKPLQDIGGKMHHLAVNAVGRHIDAGNLVVF